MALPILLLGSLDSEAEAAQALALAAGLPVRLQAGPFRGGGFGRIAPGQQATGHCALDGSDYQEGAPTVPFLLWEPMGAPLPGAVAILDHHGDRSEASFPPERAVEASSLYQLVRWLLPYLGQELRVPPGVDAWEIPPGSPDSGARSFRLSAELAEIAACDHCLAAACAGQVPGVDLSPGSSGRARLVERCRSTYGNGVAPDAFAAAWKRAEESLRTVPRWEGAGDVDVADLRGLPLDGPPASTGEVYPADAQYLPAVSPTVGRPYIARCRRRDGAIGLRFGGFDGGNPAHVALLAGLPARAAELGVYGADAPSPNNFYSAPARGLAGGTFLRD